MKTQPSVRTLERRRRALAARLGRLGLVLQGSIVRRTRRRDDPTAPGRAKTCGPYYQWTWKHHGKTVTLHLSASQARAYQKAIDNHREAQRLLRELRDVSFQILEATTVSVRRRKRRNPLDFPLS